MEHRRDTDRRALLLGHGRSVTSHGGVRSDPGFPCGDEFGPGGWILRYDLEATGPSRTTVTLTYDWSAVPPQVREYLQFPPFGPDHLDNSLQHLSDLVA